MEIEIRGSRPNIGKSIVAEITRRSLAQYGFRVNTVSQDGDSEMFKARTDDELRLMASQLFGTVAPLVTVLDQNTRVQGKKQ